MSAPLPPQEPLLSSDALPLFDPDAPAPVFKDLPPPQAIPSRFAAPLHRESLVAVPRAGKTAPSPQETARERFRAKKTASTALPAPKCAPVAARRGAIRALFSRGAPPWPPSVAVVRELAPAADAVSARRTSADGGVPTRGGAYVRTTFEETLPAVEYDLDSDDEAFLTRYEEKTGTHGTKIDGNILEFAMDLLEKEAYARAVAMPVRLAPHAIESVDCAVCGSGGSEDTNQIVFCDGCNVGVHQECYGVRFIPEGSWLCRPCEAGCPRVDANNSNKRGIK